LTKTKQIDLQKLAAAIGIRLRTYREDRCLSQQEMADGAGMSRQQLGRYEKGEDLPHTITLIRLSLYMERSTHWILFGDAPQERVPADPAVRECMFDLEAASQDCRRSVVEMAYALMTADRATEKLLSSGTRGNG
jgi:transcriptional regulator with XRE-family HTH domain